MLLFGLIPGMPSLVFIFLALGLFGSGMVGILQPLADAELKRESDESERTNAGIMADFVEPLGLSPDEVHSWRQDLRDLGAHGRYFFSLNRYLFLAVKPIPDRT